MNRDIHHLREEYQIGSLMESNLPENPISLFKEWFDFAHEKGIPEPNAMTLATVDSEAKPSARVVLLKGFDPNGFVFYTNYESRKGAELADNPNVALVFLWLQLERQIRIEGQVVKLPEVESTKYFQSRPRESQIGAWSSPQSQIIDNRQILEEKYEHTAHQFKNNDSLPKPEHWGGYLVEPTTIEFWQGRSSRLHDRIQYIKRDDSWKSQRLAP